MQMLKKSYKHIFFDLDHTLWNFEASANHTLLDMFHRFALGEKGIPDGEHFIDAYHIHNDRLWSLYREGNLVKEVLRSLRFADTMRDFGFEDDELAENLSAYYLYHSPRNVYLFPDAIEILTYLKPKYNLHLITNGFEEVQHIKLVSSGLKPFFKEIVTSEEAGVKKPDPEIFTYALRKADASVTESLMIGDSLEVDIIGAKNVGMDQVFFNPEGIDHNEDVTLEITALSELRNYF